MYFSFNDNVNISIKVMQCNTTLLPIKKHKFYFSLFLFIPDARFYKQIEDDTVFKCT